MPRHPHHPHHPPPHCGRHRHPHPHGGERHPPPHHHPPHHHRHHHHPPHHPPPPPPHHGGPPPPHPPCGRHPPPWHFGADYPPPPCWDHPPHHPPPPQQPAPPSPSTVEHPQNPPSQPEVNIPVVCKSSPEDGKGLSTLTTTECAKSATASGEPVSVSESLSAALIGGGTTPLNVGPSRSAELPGTQDASDANVHNEFLCPITMEIMKDPVIAADGFTYEHSAIRQWLEGGNSNSPMTNVPLANTHLLPNRALKALIQRHLEQGRQ